jgi:hypothetical protein
MGRGLLEVRVCACPGRDSNLDDKQQKQPFRRKRRLPDETTGKIVLVQQKSVFQAIRGSPVLN